MLQADPAVRPTATELLGHPYVREHCNRLFETLQNRAPNTNISTFEDSCEKEFRQKYQQLQGKLGTKKAVEAIIELMAPEMSNQMLRARTDEQLKDLARSAWNKRHGKVEEESTALSDACDSVQELTMTIRDMAIHPVPPKRQDPSVLRDQILGLVQSWDEFRLLHSLIKNKVELQKIAVVLPPGRFKSLESSGALNMMRQLIANEFDLEALSID
jgi:hypothetical protein